MIARDKLLHIAAGFAVALFACALGGLMFAALLLTLHRMGLIAL